MILDNEEQKTLLMQMFNEIKFPGSMVKQANSLIVAIENAEIKKA